MIIAMLKAQVQLSLRSILRMCTKSMSRPIVRKPNKKNSLIFSYPTRMENHLRWPKLRTKNLSWQGVWSFGFVVICCHSQQWKTMVSKIFTNRSEMKRSCLHEQMFPTMHWTTCTKYWKNNWFKNWKVLQVITCIWILSFSYSCDI